MGIIKKEPWRAPRLLIERQSLKTLSTLRTLRAPISYLTTTLNFVLSCSRSGKVKHAYLSTHLTTTFVPFRM